MQMPSRGEEQTQGRRRSHPAVPRGCVGVVFEDHQQETEKREEGASVVPLFFWESGGGGEGRERRGPDGADVGAAPADSHVAREARGLGWATATLDGNGGGGREGEERRGSLGSRRGGLGRALEEGGRVPWGSVCEGSVGDRALETGGVGGRRRPGRPLSRVRPGDRRGGRAGRVPIDPPRAGVVGNRQARSAGAPRRLLHARRARHQ
mmetsp:Transcript_1023/g.3484  ORF Transcript_1023/g.3484 Transcript_1023/m.3484 type:complete len:208 (-) Transcript_1023:175-798(-)